MVELFKRLTDSQFQASLSTLAHCIQASSDAVWHRPVAKYPFCQVAFHTLFFTDYYLGPDAESLRRQSFHAANPKLFGDYEQLADRAPTSLYQKPQIASYLQFCREKATAVIAAETEESLAAPARFQRRNFSRAELYVYNIRHLQHHAAQLILTLRLHSTADIPWIGSGWRQPASGKVNG